MISISNTAHIHTTHTYCSLAKECPWVAHITTLPKRGVSTLLSVLHLTMKERPCHVSSDSMQRCRVASNLQYSITQVLTSDMHSAWDVLLKLHTKLVPGWVLILLVVNFDPIQEIEPKVGALFVSGDSFMRLQYTYIHTYIHTYCFVM